MRPVSILCQKDPSRPEQGLQGLYLTQISRLENRGYIMFKYVILICFCLTPLRARAEPRLELALKGGFDAATFNKDYRFNRYGFSGGLAGNLGWSLSGRLSLAGQLDLLYTPRGTEV